GCLPHRRRRGECNQCHDHHFFNPERNAFHFGLTSGVSCCAHSSLEPFKPAVSIGQLFVQNGGAIDLEDQLRPNFATELTVTVTVAGAANTASKLSVACNSG